MADEDLEDRPEATQAEAPEPSKDTRTRYYTAHEVAMHNRAEVTKHIDPKSNVELPFLPHGRFLHVAPPEPTATWNTLDVTPWWRDPQYVVGFLTTRARWIEIVNVLTQQRHPLQVCCEETIDDIQARYLHYNAHAKSYTWKFLDDDDFVPLQMNLTLEQNGIQDETPLFETLDMDEHTFKPSLYIYFNDDLSVA